MVDVRLKSHNLSVQHSILDLLHQVKGPVLALDQGQMRIGASEDRRDVGQQVGADRGNDTESEPAVEEVAQVAGRFLEFALCAEDTPRLFNENGAGGGDPNPMPAALENLHAQLRFGVRDLRGQ